MDDVFSFSGYLYKWTNILKGYEKRWFILQNNLLSYYRNPNAVGKRCRGTFNLKGASLVAPTSRTSFILVEASGRKHHLKALNEADKEKWLKVLGELTNGQINTDIESDTYSEELIVNNDQHHISETPTRRRFFRSGKSKLGSRHSSSPNLPQDNGKIPKSEKNLNSTSSSLGPMNKVNLSKVGLRPSLRTANISMHDSKQKPTSSCTSAYTQLLSRLRKHSLTNDAVALHELVASVHCFRERLKNQMQSIGNQVTSVESLLSTSQVNTGVGCSSPSCHDTQDLSSSDVADRLRSVLKNHRQHIEEFYETCSEAMEFLVNNFERWQRRILTEQERCVGLERTVEQLARQHRALELQLAQYYAPLDAGTIEPFRPSYTASLRQEHPGRSIARLESFESNEDDQFYDACSLLNYQSNEALASIESKQISKPSLGVPHSENLRASATSLISLEHAEESSESDSATEDFEQLDTQRIRKSLVPKVQPEIPKPGSEPLYRNIIKVTEPRRTTIPPSPKISLNLWSLIKNGIGKDITKIPLPVNFNEPISFLQRASEDLTYSELLDKASATQDPVQQMALVAAFSVSCYATTAIRINKPFNPLWGETFELDRTDDSYGWRLIAEQVSHHPPGSALYCESVRCGWKLWLEFYLVSKFRGKYMSIYPKGTVHLVLPDGSHYTWTKATTVVHNLIVGSLWIDNYGEVTIRNHTSGYCCPMRFIAHSYFGRGPPKQVAGVVKNPSGTSLCLVRGTWDSYIESQPVAQDGTPVGGSTLLWQAIPPPPGSEDMYNFSLFTIQLNEMEPAIAPTDSRLRPDQRLMENGAWDQANEEKRRLEQKQRAKRHKWEAEQAVSASPLEPLFTPCWFSLSTDSVTGEESFVYTGKYWEAKSKQDWSRCPDIF